jgi:hypothetical protein
MAAGYDLHQLQSQLLRRLVVTLTWQVKVVKVNQNFWKQYLPSGKRLHSELENHHV